MNKTITCLPKVRGEYKIDANISNLTWFKAGGNAKFLFKPADKDDLINFLINKPKNLKIYIIGAGSNVIIRDCGFDGVIIKLTRKFADIKLDGLEITAGSAALDYNLSMFALENNVGGFEFFSGIPGSVGGAIAMNAGAYECETKDLLVYAHAVDHSGNFYCLANSDFDFKYRSNGLKQDLIFLEAKFKGYYKKSSQINQDIKNILYKRQESQPLRTKTGGSTFSNPDGFKAWQLIDQAGCRGLRIGDAVISEKHCNFMINLGNASASDLENLGNEVKKRVFEVFGIELQWEIRFIG